MRVVPGRCARRDTLLWQYPAEIKKGFSARHPCNVRLVGEYSLLQPTFPNDS